MELTREGAREAAREELSRAPYQEAQPSLLERAITFVLDQLDRLFGALDGLPGGGALQVLVVLLVLLLLAVALTRVRPLGRTARRGTALEAGARLTPDGHRAAAEAAAGEGRWAEAVRERLRAVVRELEARGVLDPRPGRTATEVARDGGARVPALAEDLSRGARAFDEVWYGGRPADASTYGLLVAVDEAVTRAVGGRVRA